MPKKRRERCQFDVTYMTLYPSKEGHQYVLTLVDCFTKRGWFWPLKNRDAEAVYGCVSELFEKHPFEIVQTDNGGENCNVLLKEYLDSKEIKHIRIAPYHPQANGQVESLNGLIKSHLIARVNGDWENWHKYLPLAQFDYNISYHTTIQVRYTLLLNYFADVSLWSRDWTSIHSKK